MIYLLPGGCRDEVSVQQPQLAEQNPVDKGDRRQLLQRHMSLELEFLLFREERHRCYYRIQRKVSDRKQVEEPLLATSNWVTTPARRRGDETCKQVGRKSVSNVCQREGLRWKSDGEPTWKHVESCAGFVGGGSTTLNYRKRYVVTSFSLSVPRGGT